MVLLLIGSLRRLSTFCVVGLLSLSVTHRSEAGSSNSRVDSLQKGSTFVVGKTSFTILGTAGKGRRAVVYRVQDKEGVIFALKVAKKDDPETRESLASESLKADQSLAVGLPTSQVLFEAPTFILKTWVEGTTGDVVLQRYRDGDRSFQTAIDSLLDLVSSIRSQGGYIGDFRPPNLVWTGRTWVRIDSGSIQTGLTVQQAHEKWSSADERGPKFERRWGLKIPALPVASCSELLDPSK